MDSHQAIEICLNECIEILRQTVNRHPVCPACLAELLAGALASMVVIGQIPHGGQDPDEPELPFDAPAHQTVQ